MQAILLTKFCDEAKYVDLESPMTKISSYLAHETIEFVKLTAECQAILAGVYFPA